MTAISMGEFWFIAAVFFGTGWACRSLLLAAVAREKRNDRYDIAYRSFQGECRKQRMGLPAHPRSLP